MAGYWLQIKYTDEQKIQAWDTRLPEVMNTRVVIPEDPVGFKHLRRVVLAIGGHNMCA